MGKAMAGVTCFRRLLLVVVLVLLGSQPARGDEETEIRAGLRRNVEFERIGRRVEAAGRILVGDAAPLDRALACMDLARLADGRAVSHLSRGLQASHVGVATVSLYALAAFPQRALREGGGTDLYVALVEELDSPLPHRRALVLQLLQRIAGQAGSVDQAAWREWGASHAQLLAVRAPRPPFDTEGHDSILVARLRQELAPHPTVATERESRPVEHEPPASARPLDLVIALDTTESMRAAWPGLRGQVVAFVRALRLIDPEARIGALTFGDRVRRRAPMRDTPARTIQLLERSTMRGGGDTEEGIDRALLEVAGDRAFPWRAEAAKNVVIVTDAPPHQPQVGRIRTAIHRLRQLGHAHVHVLNTGPIDFQELKDIAAEGSGLCVPPRLLHEVVRAVVRATTTPGGKEPTEELARAWLAIARL